VVRALTWGEPQGSCLHCAIERSRHDLRGESRAQVEAEAAEKERAKEEEERRLRELEMEYSATVARLEQRVQQADQQSQLEVRPRHRTNVSTMDSCTL
jgi:protein subunit release factor B